MLTPPPLLSFLELQINAATHVLLRRTNSRWDQGGEGLQDLVGNCDWADRSFVSWTALVLRSVSLRPSLLQTEVSPFSMNRCGHGCESNAISFFPDQFVAL